ncbi:2-methoxy-6-polyprenyl-1,4-benzoquinol methylase, mitochondrial [subsurface metagenome]|nr:methyltransferase domain-containing protein [Hadesarchaea archaeon]
MSNLNYKTNIKEAYSYSPERLRQKGSVAFFNRHEERGLGQLMNFSKSDVVLDAGCGYGRWTIKLAPKVRKVVAVDLSEPFLAELRERGYPNVDVICADLESLNFREYFDGIIFSGALEHFKDKRAILEKLRQILKPGGGIYISCWTSDMLTPLRIFRRCAEDEMRVGDRSWYIKEPSLEEMARYLKEADYKQIHVKSIYGNTQDLSPNTEEAYNDYIRRPRVVNVVNIARAER